jgi:pimeloyl-ACP methyl ester carboxylesterase
MAGPTILLVHGGGDNGGTWAELVPRLQTLGRVVAPDLRGHGHGPPLPDGAGPFDLHTPLLSELPPDGDAVFVGHSLGAAVVLALARLRPPLGLVLVDGAPHRGVLHPDHTFDPAAYEARMRAMNLGAVRTAEELEALVAADTHPAQDRRAHVPLDDGTFQHRPTLVDLVRLAAAGRRPDNPYLELARYRDVAVPTIALNATGGIAAAVRDEVEALTGHNPNIDSRGLEASHSLHWDRPEAVVAAVEELLERRA